MEPIPEPVRRYESYTHEAMAAEVGAGNDPAAAGELGAAWAGLAERLRQSAGVLSQVAGLSREHWEGQAGDAVRATLARAADWSRRAGDTSSRLAAAVTEQAGIAARARAEMPPPVGYDPGAMIREAVGSGDVLALLGLSDAMDERRAEAEAARLKAVDVMNSRDAALRAAVPAVGFEARPARGAS
ncbi:PE-PGRS family protein [Amycolatopsis cynarae]|uniref:PE-PGRS family protein n=1 Tax=Amycolatopsis cynarae TaxID=2995223 RepID=A0ABY7AUN1_9PSEU|nr:PE-PGRS family protein [Amycolatopsis sp. HUAS 11-8]WAL63671.1 PE-PGRS family protein [Amycolatopsis sp. HUAS 11-8]